MSAQTDALKAQVAAIVPAIQTAISQEGALKSKLDAALADNVAKAAIIAADDAKIADLTAQLLAAQANQTSAADTQAVVDVTAQLAAVAQPLVDANAVNAPSN